MTLTIDLIRQVALKRGNFTLASGEKSDHYFDVKSIILDAAAGWNLRISLTNAIMGNIDYQRPIYLGGIGMGGALLVCDMLPQVDTHLGLSSKLAPLVYTKGFVIREKVARVSQCQIAGHLPDPKSDYLCFMLEDVVTTGGSVMAAVKTLVAYGIRVDRVIAVIDRSGGKAEQVFGQCDIPFQALFKAEDILKDIVGEID